MGFFGRLTLYCYDGLEFLKGNMVRFVACLIFALIGIVAGVWYGVIVSSEAVFFFHFNNKIIMVISGNTSFIKYLFFLALEAILIVGLLIALALNYYASFLHFLIFLYKGYVVAFNVVIIIAAAKLSSLPFLLLCYLPLSLVMIVIFSLISLKTATSAYRVLLTKCPERMSDTLLPLLPLFLVAFLCCFIECILTFILTSGIIIN